MATQPVVYSQLTLQDAKNHVFDIINENASGQFAESRVVNHLNAAARRIFHKVNRAAFEAWITTTIGTPNYVVPAMSDGDGKQHIIEAQFDGTSLTESPYDQDTATTGTPLYYAGFNGELWLYPTPDAEGELRVSYMPQYIAPSGNTSVFPLSDEQVEACVLYAAYMMKLMDEEYTAAGMLKSQWEDAFKDATAIQTGVYKWGRNVPVQERGSAGSQPASA